MEESGFHRADFREISYMRLLLKYIDTFLIWVKSITNNRQLTVGRTYICDNRSPLLVFITDTDNAFYETQAVTAATFADHNSHDILQIYR